MTVLETISSKATWIEVGKPPIFLWLIPYHYDSSDLLKNFSHGWSPKDRVHSFISILHDNTAVKTSRCTLQMYHTATPRAFFICCGIESEKSDLGIFPTSKERSCCSSMFFMSPLREALAWERTLSVCLRSLQNELYSVSKSMSILNRSIL